MKKIVLILLFVLCFPLMGNAEVWISDTPNIGLYDYSNKVVLQDDFLTGGSTSGTIGSLGLNSGGTIGTGTSQDNHPGTVNVSTSTVISTIARLNMFGSTILQYNDTNSLVWIIRLITNDANTQVRLGYHASWAANPSTDGVYFEKLDADTNWFCVARAGGVSAPRIDTGIAINTNWTIFNIISTSTQADFYINGALVGTLTTNLPSPTTLLGAGINIINSAAANKSLDVDFFQQILSVVR